VPHLEALCSLLAPPPSPSGWHLVISISPRVFPQHYLVGRYPPPPTRTVTAVGRDYLEGAALPGIPVRIAAVPPSHIFDNIAHGAPQVRRDLVFVLKLFVMHLKTHPQATQDASRVDKVLLLCTSILVECPEPPAQVSHHIQLTGTRETLIA